MIFASWPSTTRQPNAALHHRGRWASECGRRDIQPWYADSAGQYNLRQYIRRHRQPWHTYGGEQHHFRQHGRWYPQHGTATVRNSTISGNTGESGSSGGGILNGGTLTMQNSRITGNKATYGGGMASRGTAILFQSTISGNTADSGGGLMNGGFVYSSNGSLALVESTVLSNTAILRGGEVYSKYMNTLRLVEHHHNRKCRKPWRWRYLHIGGRRGDRAEQHDFRQSVRLRWRYTNERYSDDDPKFSFRQYGYIWHWRQVTLQWYSEGTEQYHFRQCRWR